MGFSTALFVTFFDDADVKNQDKVSSVPATAAKLLQSSS